MATRTRPAAPARPQLDAVLPSDQVAGRHVTVADFIVEQVRAGVDPVNAAGLCGVTPQELLAWTREGTLAMARLNSGASWAHDFTRYQQDCAVFTDTLTRARATHIARLTLIAEQGARGGLQRRRTVTKTVNGNVAEVVTTVEETLPDLDMVRWKLERLEPTVYGQRSTLSLSVVDLTDTDDVGDDLERRLTELAERLDQRAIEATAVDVEDPASAQVDGADQ